jgi:drug/metabolite transporter (DMT)-like permease
MGHLYFAGKGAMSLFVVGLVICSAVMHAGWNLLARGQKSERIFFGRMLLSFAAAGFVPTAISEAFARSTPPVAWACAAAAGFCCAVYFFFLGRAYEDADFTVTYPLVRATPVLLVAFADVLWARYPTAAGWTGIMLVVVGCFLVPLHSFGEFDVWTYLKRSRLWMLLAGLGSVGYTVFNKMAAEMVQPGAASAARYGYMFFLSTAVFYHWLMRLDKPPRPRGGAGSWSVSFFGGALMFFAYWLVLWAFQLARQASYVVAFRQFSIIVGVVLAFLLYREKGFAVRVTGSSLITAGLILIGMWG